MTLIAVTKTKPASDVRLLSELGVSDVGENRDAEAGDKAAECADLGLRWHFVGLADQQGPRVALRRRRGVGRPARSSLPSVRPTCRAGHVIECLLEVSLDGARPAAVR